MRPAFACAGNGTPGSYHGASEFPKGDAPTIAVDVEFVDLQCRTAAGFAFSAHFVLALFVTTNNGIRRNNAGSNREAAIRPNALYRQYDVVCRNNARTHYQCY